MRLETCIGRWLGLQGHRVREIREEGEEVVAELEAITGHLPKCGVCGRKVRRTKGRTVRRVWRDLSLRNRRLILAYTPRRVVCPECGIRVEMIPWSERWSRVTRSLARSVGELSRHTDLSTVAKHFGLNWKTVSSIIGRLVEWGLGKKRRKALRIIGIDEVSRKKGHKYLTLVYDLERGELSWVGKGRSISTVEGFFEFLGKRRSRNLQAVSMDMWAPYLQVVEERAPQAGVCFDRFHVVRHLNAAVDEVRRELVRNLKGPERALVKGTRFVLLKNPWNHTDKQKKALNEMLKKNSPLSRAWYLKEDFQRFWDYISEGWARRHLQQWLWWASHSRLDSFKKFAKMVRKHIGGILAWTTLRVTNGALEGMNNKVKLVSHRSYGFRNEDRYIQAIYHNCGNLPLPPDC